MKSVLYILFGSMAVIFCACKNSQSAKKPQKPDRSKAILDTLNIPDEKSDRQIKITLSPDSTYVLQKTITSYTPQQPYQSTKYFVYSLKNDQVVFQDSILKGDVLWYDNQHLKVTTIPEIIESDYDPEEYTFLINIDTGIKKKISEISKEHSAK